MAEPDRVTIQFILVSRSPMDEGEARARRVFDKARAGEDFDSLVQKYTDSRHRPPTAAVHRIEELYRKASRDGSPCDVPLFQAYLETLLRCGKNFAAIKASLEGRRKTHPLLPPEVLKKLDQHFPGRGEDWTPFPPALTEIVWLTRDRAVFDDLLREFDQTVPTDRLTMTNEGIPKSSDAEAPRARMIKTWGDIAFGLQPGEIGFAGLAPKGPPVFGILKRIK